MYFIGGGPRCSRLFSLCFSLKSLRFQFPQYSSSAFLIRGLARRTLSQKSHRSSWTEGTIFRFRVIGPEVSSPSQPYIFAYMVAIVRCVCVTHNFHFTLRRKGNARRRRYQYILSPSRECKPAHVRTHNQPLFSNKSSSSSAGKSTK